MTLWHLALCSALAGLSASALAAAILLRRAGTQAQARDAPLIDARTLWTAMREVSPGRNPLPFGDLMRWAGFAFGVKGLSAIGAGASLGAGLATASWGFSGSLAALTALTAGLAPLAFVRWRISRRKAVFMTGLEAIVEGLSRALSSGLDVRAGFVLALDGAPPAVSAALAPAGRNMLTGQPIAECMVTLRHAVPLPAAGVLAAALALQSQNGGELRECLESLAGRLRAERIMAQKRDAAAAEAFSAGAILAILPAGLLMGMWAFTPASFALLAETSAGQAVLTLCVLMMASGHAVLRWLVAAALPKSLS